MTVPDEFAADIVEASKAPENGEEMEAFNHELEKGGK